MKRRVLKPIVDKILTAITAVQFAVILSLNDFELQALPLVIAFVALFAFNTMILYKYSRNF